MGQVTKENIQDVLSYHAPSQGQLAAIQNVRDGAQIFIRDILNNCPPCADTSAAIRHVREAMMTANAAISLEGKI